MPQGAASNHRKDRIVSSKHKSLKRGDIRLKGVQFKFVLPGGTNLTLSVDSIVLVGDRSKTKIRKYVPATLSR